MLVGAPALALPRPTYGAKTTTEGNRAADWPQAWRRRCMAITGWFRPYGELLESLRSPCDCHCALLRISLLTQKTTNEKVRPTSWRDSGTASPGRFVDGNTEQQMLENAPSGGRNGAPAP